MDRRDKYMITKYDKIILFDLKLQQKKDSLNLSENSCE